MKRAKGGPEDRFKQNLFRRTVGTLFFSKQAIAVYGTVSLAIYIKNRVQKAKTPVVLDGTEG